MRHDERGFTIIEILIALVVFAIIALGAIGALGVTTASGYLEAFPTSFSTVRTARDYTAAATYLQRLVEFAANQGFDAATPSGVNPYCVEGPDSGTGCSAVVALPWGSPPSPDDEPFQLNWESLVVEIEQWHWDDTNEKYCEVGATGCAATATGESVKLIQATLTWQFDDKSRSLTVKRLIEDCKTLIQGDVSFCVK